MSRYKSDHRNEAKRRFWLIAGLVLLVLVIAPIVGFIRFYNRATMLENAVLAQHESNQVAYSNMFLMVKEVAQVPDNYAEEFKDLLAIETGGKFGEGGSKAIAQWFTERDLRIPPELHGRVQDVIEANRNEFRRGQDLLLDKQRAYRDHLNRLSGRIFASISGHPKPIAGEYAPIVDADGDGRLTVLDYRPVNAARTQEVFQRGREDGPIQVFE